MSTTQGRGPQAVKNEVLDVKMEDGPPTLKSEQASVSMSEVQAKTTDSCVKKEERSVAIVPPQPSNVHTKRKGDPVKKEEPVEDEYEYSQLARADASEFGDNDDPSEDYELPPRTPANLEELPPRTPRAPRKPSQPGQEATRRLVQPGGMLNSQTTDTQAFEALGVLITPSAGYRAQHNQQAIDDSQDGAEIMDDDGNGDQGSTQATPPTTQPYPSSSRPPQSQHKFCQSFAVLHGVDADEEAIVDHNLDRMVENGVVSPSWAERHRLVAHDEPAAAHYPPDYASSSPVRPEGPAVDVHVAPPVAAPTVAHNANAITTPPRATVRPVPATAPHNPPARLIRNRYEQSIMNSVRESLEDQRTILMRSVHEAYRERNEALFDAEQLRQENERLLDAEERRRERK